MIDLNSPKTKWLFFDLGSTLIDESEAYARRIAETVAGTDVSAAAFTETASRFWAEGLDGYREALAFYHLEKAPWRSEYERPYPDCAAVLHALRERGYRLGVIANQQPGTERRLLDWDLLQFFDVIAASAECGAAKPQPEIFLYALRQTDCRPENAVMVGDRIDNDILPAKALGMRTVRILTGPAAVCMPDPDPADLTVRTLSELLDLM